MFVLRHINNFIYELTSMNTFISVKTIYLFKYPAERLNKAISDSLIHWTAE
jgi:hypothetical protein